MLLLMATLYLRLARPDAASAGGVTASSCAAASVWVADPARSLVSWLALTGNGQGRDSEKANVMSRQSNSLLGCPSGSLA
jgi:hypothetical protein